MATNACRTSKVLVNDQPVKAARELSVGEVVKVRKGPIWYHYEVVAFPKNRVGAKLVSDYCLDVTPEEEQVKLEIIRADKPNQRAKGTGRPTKKERRDLDRQRGR